MTDRETLIVGASAAGVLTAYLVAASGRPVTIVDASADPGAEQRTLIVTDRMLAITDPGVTQRSVRSRVARFEMYANGSTGSVELTRPDLVIERSVLVKDLLHAAVTTGVEVLSDHRFIAFEGANSVILAGPEGEIRRPVSVVVGADGATSAVAKGVGVRHEQISLLQAIVPRPADLPDATSRVWFLPEKTRYFFWLIPEGDREVAVGVISEDRGAVRAVLDGFMEDHHFEPAGYQAALVPRYRGWIPIHRRREATDVYLVGDAAAQVKISTVGGVVTGFRGAVVAARMICGERGRLDEARLRSELTVHAAVRRALHNFDEAAYSRLLEGLSGRARRSLGSHSRDEAMTMLFRSLATSPRIAWMGLRGLIGSPFP